MLLTRQLGKQLLRHHRSVVMPFLNAEYFAVFFPYSPLIIMNFLLRMPSVTVYHLQQLLSDISLLYN